MVSKLMDKKFSQALQDRLTRRHEIIFYLLIWPLFNFTLVVAMLIALNRAEPPLLWLAAMRLWLIFSLLWGLTNLALLGLDVRGKTLGLWQKMLLHIGLVVFCVSLVRAITPDPVSGENKLVGVGYFIAIMQMSLYVFYHNFLEVQNKNDALKSELKEAQMLTMRSRFNPHFIFNTLALIASEIPHAPDLAREIIYDFSDLLRQSFTAAGKKTISLNEELKLAETYLAIQQKRFADRLSYRMEINIADTQVLVPSLITQPLIENAIKHAVAPHAKPTHIVIAVNSDGHDINITVTNSVHHLQPESFKDGHGLTMVKSALSLHTDDTSRLSYHVGKGMGQGMDQDSCSFSLRLPINGCVDEEPAI